MPKENKPKQHSVTPESISNLIPETAPDLPRQRGELKTVGVVLPLVDIERLDRLEGSSRSHKIRRILMEYFEREEDTQEKPNAQKT